MRFTKIKVDKNGKIGLTYQKEDGKDGWDDFSMTCAQPAAPEFYKAMQALGYFAVELCELPTDYINKLIVFSVSLSYAGPQDTMGAVITCKIPLAKSNCPLVLNTPHKTDMPYSGQEPEEADPAGLLPEGCPEAINTLCEEARRYLNGTRAQTTIDIAKDIINDIKELNPDGQTSFIAGKDA